MYKFLVVLKDQDRAVICQYYDDILQTRCCVQNNAMKRFLASTIFQLPA